MTLDANVEMVTPATNVTFKVNIVRENCRGNVNMCRYCLHRTAFEERAGCLGEMALRIRFL